MPSPALLIAVILPFDVILSKFQAGQRPAASSARRRSRPLFTRRPPLPFATDHATRLRLCGAIIAGNIMPRWTRVAAVEDCPPGSQLELVVEHRVLALFNVGGSYFALDGVCPHQGGPLGEGELSGCIVTCPWHGWQFDVRSGQSQISPSIVQPAFACKVEGGAVYVDLPNVK